MRFATNVFQREYNIFEFIIFGKNMVCNEYFLTNLLFVHYIFLMMYSLGGIFFGKNHFKHFMRTS